MKKNIKGFCILAGFAVILASCSGTEYNTLSDIESNGVLTVSTNAEFPPFEYVDDTDGVTGFDIELINDYAESIGCSTDIENLDFDAALTSVQTNKVDVAIAGITVNDTREEVMDFSDSYYTSSQYIIVPEDSAITGTTIDEVRASLTANSASIGAQEGTTGYYYATGDSDWGYDTIADTSTTSYSSGGLAVTALLNGQLDCVIIDELPAEEYVANNTGLKIIDVALTSEDYAIAVSKGNDTLVDSINAYIAQIKEDGTYDQIVSDTMVD